MSTLCYSTAADPVPYDTADFDNTCQNKDLISAFYTACIGQDAKYILKKRALILDLWNLLPEEQTENKPADCFYPPVLFAKNRELFETVSEKSIPLQ